MVPLFFLLLILLSDHPPRLRLRLRTRLRRRRRQMLRPLHLHQMMRRPHHLSKQRRRSWDGEQSAQLRLR